VTVRVIEGGGPAIHEPAVCRPCWTNWSEHRATFAIEIKRVSVRPTPKTYSREGNETRPTRDISRSDAQRSTRSAPMRKSKRLGKINHKRILVTGDETLKDVEDAMSASHPSLYLMGSLLFDQSVTIYQLGLFPGDILEQYEPDEDEEPDPDDDFWRPVKDVREKGKNPEGPAFDGTLLAGSSRTRQGTGSTTKNENSSPGASAEAGPSAPVSNDLPVGPSAPEDVTMDWDNLSARIACAACTFLNPHEFLCCEICGSSLPGS